MQNTTRMLTQEEKDALLRALLKRYRRSPQAVAKVLPEAASILASLRTCKKKEVGAVVFHLTPDEKQKREQSLSQALNTLHAKKSLSKGQAIQALEDAAALIEAFPYEDHKISDAEIRKLVNVATGLSVTKKGKVTKHVLQEGEPARTVYILRGVKLNLTWDKKLMSVEIDPRQMAIAAKALSIIGIGPKGITDLSAKHDEYFVEAINAS